jgi:hypothetical protein
MSNISRQLVGGRGPGFRGATTPQGSPPTIFRVVVVEVIYDPDSLTEEEKNRIKRQVANPEIVDLMPPSSILGRDITNGHDLSDQTPSIYFPFFDSHLQLPIQPGECVSVIFDDYAFQDSTLGRWITRPSEVNQVEDLNYTHADRRYDPNILPRDAVDTPRSPNAIPGFPNGGGTPTTYTLYQENTTNPYDVIVSQSNAIKVSSQEPVPRWIKRPQELVLQGMNNTLISLGEDRTGPATRVTGSNQVDKVGYAGTIDLVCGRGRGGIPYATNVEPDPSDEKTGTSPKVIRNTRQKLEVDKNTKRQNKRRNKNEGNPDFKRDAARIYVTMNSAGDKNFRTQNSTNNQEGFQYPENTISPSQPQQQNGGIGNSYIVAKADHVRIIGRKETNPTIDGTILFLREGTKDDDLAYVFLNKGQIQLEAKEMFFGHATTKSEPYIKWTIYEQHITELKNQLKALADKLQEVTTQYDIAFRSSLAIPYGQISSLVAVGPTVKSNTESSVQSIKQAIDTIDPQDAKSLKIFGE